MRLLRRRWDDERIDGGEVDSPHVTFSEILVGVGVILFLLLTLIPIFMPTAVPAFVGVAEVGTPGRNDYIPPKTLWDWFGLVAIPFAIVVVGYVLNRADRNHERRVQDRQSEETQKIEEQRIAESRRVEERRIYETREIEHQRLVEARKIERQRLVEAREIEHQRLVEAREIERQSFAETLLRDYLDQMTELLLTRGLRTSLEGDEVRSVARARTLTVLRSVDEVRRTTVVQFLYESRLINLLVGSDTKEVISIIALNGANLGGISLVRGYLVLSNFAETNLSEANLKQAILSEANLKQAILVGANLKQAILSEANLEQANLSEANLEQANLKQAILSEANLEQAILSEANLEQANLKQANLKQAILVGARLVEANLSEARSIVHNPSTSGRFFKQIKVNLSGAKLAGANLAGTNLSGANLVEADLTGGTPVGANFERAILRGAQLLKCNFFWPC